MTRANLCHGLPWIAVHSLSCVWLFVTPWSAAHQASLFFTISWSLLKLMSIESVIPSNQLILCCPLPLLPSPAFPSIRVFSSKLALHVRGQSVGTSASALVLPVNIQHRFPLGLLIYSNNQLQLQFTAMFHPSSNLLRNGQTVPNLYR